MNPAPREYASLVTLLRRADGGPATAPATSNQDEIRQWLLEIAAGDNDLLKILESLAWRLVAAGFGVDRLTVHVGTLHPQLLGFYWQWDRQDGLIDELKVDLDGLVTERYRRSPLYGVIEKGEMFRARTDDAELMTRYPLLRELAEQGICDYTALPLGSGGEYHNAATLSTRNPTGFGDHELDELRDILAILALHVERHIAWRIARNVLDTYLGSLAGEKVLRGTIRRGAGESVRAVIWMSDLRGYSTLADTLPGDAVLAVLNQYYERMAGAVIAHGGEVLKFIGDGLLAVFPVDHADDGRRAAAHSLAAAGEALSAVRSLNHDRGGPLDHIDGWRPLNSGIGLHLGEVFFGNVGAPERLDFTVIGRAVNETSRVESLTKELGREVLLTEPVAKRLDVNLEEMGQHDLRGHAAPVTLYAVPSNQ